MKLTTDTIKHWLDHGKGIKHIAIAVGVPYMALMAFAAVAEFCNGHYFMPFVFLFCGAIGAAILTVIAAMFLRLALHFWEATAHYPLIIRVAVAPVAAALSLGFIGLMMGGNGE